jgi:hypothetical protein
MNLESEEEQD